MAKTRVLIADRNQTDLEFFKETLEDKFDLVLCSEGNDAWHKITNDEPEVVILNVDLPGEDGLEICQKIKADKKHSTTLVVLLSDVTNKDDLPDSFWRMSTGADAFLSKPFPAQKLRGTVENLMAKKIGKREVIGPGYF